eukprot:CCRYP_019477-RA/>CCRYP_019477-RA protein AED:0.26 eAED:0.26 QI:0/-1/0/1/-1/1/1/0/235
MPILLVLVASTQVSGALKGATSHVSTRRGLEEASDDDDSGLDNTWSEAAPASNRTSISEIPSKVVNQVQQYKAAAESKAWEFYKSSPSEWTENQWNFVLGVFGGLLLLSCSFVSVCCAYVCVYLNQDDSLASKDRYKKRIFHRWLTRRRSRHHDRNYVEPDNDTATNESLYTIDSQAPSVELTANDKREFLLKKSSSFKMNRLSRSVNENEGTYEGPNKYAVINESRSILEHLSQ